MRVVGLDYNGGNGHVPAHHARRRLRAVPVMGAAGLPRGEFQLHELVGHLGEQLPVHVRRRERGAGEHPGDGARGGHEPRAPSTWRSSSTRAGSCAVARPVCPTARTPASSRPHPQGLRRAAVASRATCPAIPTPRGPTGTGGHELSHTFGRRHPGFCNGNSSDDDDFTNPNGQISGQPADLRRTRLRRRGQ